MWVSYSSQWTSFLSFAMIPITGVITALSTLAQETKREQIFTATLQKATNHESALHDEIQERELDEIMQNIPESAFLAIKDLIQDSTKTSRNIPIRPPELTTKVGRPNAALEKNFSITTTDTIIDDISNALETVQAMELPQMHSDIRSSNGVTIRSLRQTHEIRFNPLLGVAKYEPKQKSRRIQQPLDNLI